MTKTPALDSYSGSSIHKVLLTDAPLINDVPTMAKLKIHRIQVTGELSAKPRPQILLVSQVG